MKKALLVIDYVYACVFPKEYQGNNFKTEKIQSLYKNIQKLINHARSRNILVIWLVPKVMPLAMMPSNLRTIVEKRKNTKGTKPSPDDIYKLKPKSNDKLFKKKYYSGFSGTDGKLNQYLINNQVRELLISGIYSTTCVDATITEAFGKGYSLKIYKNCVETIETPFSQRFQNDLFVHWKHKYGEILNV